MDNGCITFSKETLSYLGLWPATTSAQHRWLRTWRYFFPRWQMVISIYGIATQALNVYLTWGQVTDSILHIVSFELNVFVFIKIVVLFLKSKQIQDIVKPLEALQESQMQQNYSRNYLIHIHNNSQRSSWQVFVILHVINVVLHTLTHLEGYSRGTIPYRLWFPHDISTSPMFEITLVSVALIEVVDYLVITTHDFLFFALVYEIIGQFRILRHNIRHIQRNVVKAVKAREEQERKERERREQQEGEGIRESRERALENFNSAVNKVRRERFADFMTKALLADCVNAHSALIQLVEDLESTFQLSLILHVVTNTLVFQIFYYVANAAEQFDQKSVALTALLTICVLEFWLYSYACEQLTKESGLVKEAMYDCDWLESSASFKRSMRIVILRANHPITIRAAQLFPVTLEMFSAVLKNSYSYYQVLRTVAAK